MICCYTLSKFSKTHMCKTFFIINNAANSIKFLVDKKIEKFIQTNKLPHI